MRVLVTGVAGFLGRAVAEALLSRGDEVVGVDRLAGGALGALQRRRLATLRGLAFVEGDLRAQAPLRRALASGAPEVVVHLAGRGGVRDASSTEADFEADNVGALASVLGACPAPMVWASSSSVYGDASGPCAEDAPLDPLGAYARSKRAAEALVGADGRPALALRPFTVYGPWGRPDMAVWRFAEALREDREVEVCVDAWRDWTYIDDFVVAAVRAVDRVGARAGQGAVNVGAGRPASVMSVLQRLESLAGRSATRRERAPLAVEARRTCADPARARAWLDWEPRVDLDEGLRRFWTWYAREGVHGGTAAPP